MIVCTEAIVISAVKYSESSLIVKCLTVSNGTVSYFLKSVFTSRKKTLKVSHFQPLTQLDIIANHHPRRNLHYIKEAKISYLYKTVHLSFKKNTIVLFLSEILNHVLREEEENQSLFQYIKEALQWLDHSDDISNFHILFLLNLTKYLGFYPDNTHKAHHFFDLKEGKFVASTSINPFIKDHDAALLKKFLGTEFEEVHKIKIKKEDRQRILNILIQYFQLHLYDFKNPKSLSVLNEVFH